MISDRLKQRLEGFGIFWFHLFLRLFGKRGATLLLHPVILAYTLFSRKIARNTAPYLSRRFPGEGPLKNFYHRYRVLLSFASVLLDSYWLGINPKARLENQWVNIEPLMEICKAGKGAVLVSAHVGNWQTSLNVLDSLPVKMNLLAQPDQVEIEQYLGADRKGCPFEIIDSSDPFGGMIGATNALMRGELVNIMADRYLGGTSATVDFLGTPVRLPTAAYHLAATVGVPVIIFLTAKTGRDTFEVRVWKIMKPQNAARENRRAMLDRYALDFSQTLEKYVRNYPYQWYNFFDFWKQ